MSFITNEISQVTSHAHSCKPDTSEILMNVQISYKHSWLYLVCIIQYNTAARVVNSTY